MQCKDRVDWLELTYALQVTSVELYYKRQTECSPWACKSSAKADGMGGSICAASIGSVPRQSPRVAMIVARGKCC